VAGSGHQRAAKVEKVAPSLDDLRSISLLRTLTDAELSRILAKLEVRDFKARTQVTADTEIPQRVGFILQGACRFVALAPNGSSITMRSMRQGDTLGLPAAMLSHSWGGDLTHHVTRLVADEATTIGLIKQTEFRTLLADSPALSRAACSTVSAIQLDLSSRFYELATLDVRGRLLAELLRMAQRGEQIDGRLMIRSAPTPAELGDQIGAAREAVTRQLLDLEREGVISVRRREIVIEDYQRLHALDEAGAGRRIFISPEG
jgi:CRP/FNR family transcriptional regulator